MNRRKQTPIRFLALVMAIATITSFSLFATAQGVIIDNTYEQLLLDGTKSWLQNWYTEDRLKEHFLFYK